jgi:hypothetical protein
MEGSNSTEPNKTGFNAVKTSKNYDNNLTIDKIKDIISYLEWISKSSEILANKIGQELLIYQFSRVPRDHAQSEAPRDSRKPMIVRSSYNFCTKYTQCKNFYNKFDTPTCREHHYVHSFLKYDVDSVITFLNYMITNNINLIRDDFNNVYLSVKTICFVTRHMAKEMSYIDFVTKNNADAFHRNNPIDLSKKKNITRKPVHFSNPKFINKHDSPGPRMNPIRIHDNVFPVKVPEKNNNIMVHERPRNPRNFSRGFRSVPYGTIKKPPTTTNIYSVLMRS